MEQSPVTNSSTNEDDDNYKGLTAYDSLNKGDATTDESSLGEEGLTTSRVNRAATDSDTTDADWTREHDGPETRTTTNASTDTANRPPLPNGDTGYAG